VWVVSDDALLDGLATGDPDAAAAFVERFQRRVFGVALRIVNDTRLAEDVAQETFLRAWQRSSAFDPRRGTVTAWLLTIARNLAIDTVRLRRIVIVEPSEILARPDPAGDKGPDELAILSSDTERLHRALELLPPEQGRAIVLAAFYGRTAREIADTESIPLGTAKTRIRTAMLRLRAALVDDTEASE
jgi:RNA polymerase sigma-70 factor (ECF subfamily)